MNGIYTGSIPVADREIGAMTAGIDRRSQGADFVHEFLRIGAAEDRGRMNQNAALAYDIAISAPRNRRPPEGTSP